MPEAPRTVRIDVGEVTLVWGRPADCKRALRDESLLKHLTLPIGERLARALSMVRRVPREPQAS